MLRILGKETQKEMVNLLKYGLEYLKNQEKPSIEEIKNGEHIVKLSEELIKVEEEKDARVMEAVDKLSNIEMYIGNVHKEMNHCELVAVLKDIRCVVDEVEYFINWGENKKKFQ